MALSILVCNYFFFKPEYSVTLSDKGNFFRLLIFALVLLLITLISAALRSAQHEAKAHLRRLRASEERFQLALSSSSLTLFQQDKALRYEWIHHRQGEAIASILGKTDYDLFPPDEADHLTAIKQRVLQSGIAAREEVRVTINGELRYYDLLVEPLHNSDGSRRGITCAALEISDRKRAEAALRESDSRFRKLVEANIFGVTLCDADGTFIYSNDAFLQIVGYTRDDLTSRRLKWQDITPAEYLDRDRAAAEELSVKQTFTPFEKEYIRKDGSRVPVLIGGTLLQNSSSEPSQMVCFYLDLSQLRQKEIELRRATERFELAASAAKGLVYEWDVRRNQIERTQGLMQVIGYAPEEAEPTIAWWNQWVHPDDLGRLQGAAHGALQDGSDEFMVEYRVRHRDGDYRYVWDRAKIERNADGTVRRIVGFNIDISDRKRIEEALRESEARFRMLADTAPVMVWMAGANKHCDYLNQGWLTFTGRSLEQELGDGWLANIHPDDLYPCLEAYKSAFVVQQPLTVEYRLRRHDGQYRWILDTGVPRFTPDGSFLGYIGTCIDISDRKRSEDAQQYLADISKVLSSSLDYQTILTSLAQLTVPHLADWCTIHIREDDGLVRPLAIAHANPAKVAWAEELNRTYGFDPDYPRGVARVLRTGQSEFYPFIADDLLVEVARDQDHLRILQEVGFSSVMIVPLVAHEHILGAISFIAAESGHHYDHQDLALAEELARRAALAVDNARLYRTAQRNRTKAEAANRSKDEFLATLSHELRTPLNAMLGWMQLLTNRQLDVATTQQALETVHRNTRMLSTIIKDLLDVSSITAGKLRLQICPVNLVPVIEAAIAAVYPAAIAKSIDLQFAIANNTPNRIIEAVTEPQQDGNSLAVPAPPTPSTFWIMGDPDRLQQVIWNLLANAIKFTPHAGRVDVHLSLSEGNTVQIQVMDTGVGINPDFLPYVFDRFSQADMTTTKAYGGLGLGLAIVRYLVEMQGGTVDATSDGKNQGATFTIRLPLLQNQALLNPGMKSSDPPSP